MSQDSGGSLDICVQNLGGISSLETSIPAGITILSGENATNRTSFLRSVSASLGAEESASTLKTDAESGSVSLSFDEETATRKYKRNGNSVVKTGTPLSDKPELVDSFVAIFSTNPARRAVRNGGENLRSILMRGVDTAAIKSEIQSLKQQRSRLEAQLEEIERAQEKLPAKENRRQQLESDLDDVEADISRVESNIEEYKTTVDEIEKAEDYLDSLDTRREELRRVENRIDGTKSNLQSLRDERKALEAELKSVSIPEDRRHHLQQKKRSLESEINQLQNIVTELSDIISHNQSLLDDGKAVQTFTNDEEVVSQIDPARTKVQCWTCGSEVEREEIISRTETLTEIRSEKNQKLRELRENLSSVKEELSSIRDDRRERENLEQDLQNTISTIESEEESLQELTEEADHLQEKIDELQKQVEETEELRDSNLPEAYEELSQLEHKRGKIETNLDQVNESIRSLKETIEKKDQTDERLSTVKNDLDTARGRIEKIERDIVTRFNDQMDDLIELLEYENISRVWLERKVNDQSKHSAFEIHVVRNTEDGSVYEDSLSTLSESEREIIGIMIALSGYFVHDLDQEIPIVLFDSVEVIDAKRLETLLEYIQTYAPYIITALLPEEASAIDKRTMHAPTFEVQ